MIIEFVRTMIVPFGLMMIMFSLGMSLNLVDFRRVLRTPGPLLVGYASQMLLMPLAAMTLVVLAAPPPMAAMGILALSVCPGGVTSNAIVFLARADVALSVSLTFLSSLTAIFTAPIIVSLVLSRFAYELNVPSIDIGDAMLLLFLFSVLPILTGMMARMLLPRLAKCILIWLRPASFGVLLAVVSSSLSASWDVVTMQLFSAVPVALLLNMCGMALGLALGHYYRFDNAQKTTIAIELGVQNVTMATFMALLIVNRLELSAAPTVYGTIMIINATAMALWQGRRKSAG